MCRGMCVWSQRYEVTQYSTYVHGLKVTNAPRSDRRAPRVNLHPNEHIRAYGVGGDKMFYKGRFAPLKKNMVKLSYKYYLEFKFSSLCSLSLQGRTEERMKE